MGTLRVALVQLESRDDVDDNIARAAALASEAADGADLVVLPEYVQYRGTDDGFRASARPIPGPTTEPFQAIARDRRTWILAGSHAEASPDPERPANTAVLFDRDGSIVATYRKLHLFDVAVDDGPADTESARVMPGDRAVVADVDGIGLGLSICYDLRFPELYRALALAGAGVLAVPAVFTERTGRDHWEVLLRARAIENGAWVMAAAGCGAGGPGAIPAWGHSMVVDPWGRVVAEAGMDEGIVRATIDTDAVDAARRQIPALANRRPEALPPARTVERVDARGAVAAEP
jgi:predicted amidohydrolase